MHELHDFMTRVSRELAAEYNRIHQRAAEDPGTAGDQGEENWATILREWLPREFEVVTKGRILGPYGDVSGQVDVLVLSPGYPRYLLDKKLYLASAVVAAFECKVTFRPRDVRKSIDLGVNIKRLTPSRVGSPYREVTSTIIYGILAHTSEWTDPRALSAVVRTAHEDIVRHPVEITDLICVADLTTWAVTKRLCSAKHDHDGWHMYGVSEGVNPFRFAPLAGVLVGMQEYSSHSDDFPMSPIGVLLLNLYRRLAWDSPELRPVADYLWLAGLGGASVAEMSFIDGRFFSPDVSQRAESGHIAHGVIPGRWEEWCMAFYGPD